MKKIIYNHQRNNKMKKIIFGYFILFGSICFAQNNAVTECNRFIIEPWLYNESVSDSTRVYLWKNYWYLPILNDDEMKPMIPNDLIIRMVVYGDMDVTGGDIDIEGKLIVESNLCFKYGESDDSFNVVNPQFTEKHLLINDTIEMKSVVKQLKEKSVVIIKTERFPMKEFLWTHGITTNEFKEPNTPNGRAKIYAVNQLIINTVIKNPQGEIIRTFEFTMPISGCYGNPIGNGWEF